MKDKFGNSISPHSDARCSGGMDAVNKSWNSVYGEPMTDEQVAARERKYTFKEHDLVTRDGVTMSHEEYTSIADEAERHGFSAKTEDEKKTALAHRNAHIFINHIGAEFVPHSAHTLGELGFHILSKVEQEGMDAVTSENRAAYERERQLLAESGLMTMTDINDNYSTLQMAGSLHEAEKSEKKSGFFSSYASECLDMYLNNKKVVFSTQEDLESYLGASADEAEFREHINTGVLQSLRESGWEGMQKYCEASIAAQEARAKEAARLLAASTGGATSTSATDTAAPSQKRRRSRPAKPLFSVRPIKSRNGETHEARTERKKNELIARLKNYIETECPDTMSSKGFLSSSAHSTTKSGSLSLRSAMKGGRAARKQDEMTASSALETSQSFMSDATGAATVTASQYSFPTGAAKRGASGHSFPARTGASSAANTLSEWSAARVRQALKQGMRQPPTTTSCASEMNTSAYSNNTLSSMPSIGVA